MRKVTPNFSCSKCGDKLGNCTTDRKFDVWGLSKCTNKKCDFVIDAYDLINKRNQKMVQV